MRDLIFALPPETQRNPQVLRLQRRAQFMADAAETNAVALRRRAIAGRDSDSFPADNIWTDPRQLS